MKGNNEALIGNKFASKREKFTTEQIVEAIRKSYGILSDACEMLSINRTTLSIWISQEPELQEAVKQAREGDLKDFIEGALLKNIKAGKEASIIFASKTQLRSRGYKEQIDIADKSKVEDEIATASEDELMEIIRKASKRIQDAGLGE